MILEKEDSNQSGNDYYGAIRNTAVQKYGRKFMGEINEIKKLWTNKIYLVSFVGRQLAIKLKSFYHDIYSNSKDVKWGYITF